MYLATSDESGVSLVHRLRYDKRASVDCIPEMELSLTDT